jgi:8-oxo-dGTP diphosphatase
VYQQYKENICNRAFKCGSELPEYVALILRNGGSQSPDRWLRELRNNQTGAIKFEIKPICVYSVTGKTRVNDTGEETFGLLCFAEITEFAKELHSEMVKVVLMDELPENWTYPLIQPKLIENKENLKLY